MAMNSSVSRWKLGFLIVSIPLAAFLLWRATRTPSATLETGPLWYYDIAGKKLTRRIDSIPPIETDGTTLVRAYVFSCGECGDSAQRFIGYLEQFDPEMKKSWDKTMTRSYFGPHGINEFGEEELKKLPARTVMVRAESDPEWADAFDAKGEQLRQQVSSRCTAGTTPRSCDHEDFKP